MEERTKPIREIDYHAKLAESYINQAIKALKEEIGDCMISVVTHHRDGVTTKATLKIEMEID